MTSIVDDLRKWARRAAEVPDHRPLLDGVPELFHLLTDAADRIEYLSEPIRNKKMSKEQISDAITLEIERKLCSFCCDRLYDKPKAEPCPDCLLQYFEESERVAVAAIICKAIEEKLR